MKKIKTYLIHGSLGSGKTTLLTKLLQSKLFPNTVIIENEFANYNFDKNILSQESKIYDVSGGCICCSSGRELFDALNQIAQEKNINYLFIETTGVASSIQLIKQLFLSSEFDEHYELVSNVYIIDILENTLETIKKEKTLDLAMADIIIINKTDLVPKKKTQELKKYIQTVTDAQIITTKHGKIDPKIMYAQAKSKADAILLANLDNLANYFIDHSQSSMYQVIYPTKKIEENELIETVHKVKQQQNIEIDRIKGVLTNKTGKRFSINATRNYHKITPFTHGPQNDVLVIIGKNITRENIQILEKQLC